MRDMSDCEYIIRKWKNRYNDNFQIKSEWEKTRNLILIIGKSFVDD